MNEPAGHSLHTVFLIPAFVCAIPLPVHGQHLTLAFFFFVRTMFPLHGLHSSYNGSNSCPPGQLIGTHFVCCVFARVPLGQSSQLSMFALGAILCLEQSQHSSFPFCVPGGHRMHRPLIMGDVPFTQRVHTTDPGRLDVPGGQRVQRECVATPDQVGV